MPVLSLIIVVCGLIYIINRIYAKYWSRDLSLSIRFSASKAFEGDSLYLSEEIVNRKWLPLPWIAVKFQISKNLLFEDETNNNISDDCYRNDLFSIMAYQKITRKLNFVCDKRGYYPIKSIDLLSTNLLLSKRYYKFIDANTYLTVYPRPLNLQGLDFDSKKITGSIAARRFINPDPFEFKGVREYQPYDDFKTINFKASAKTNQWMVNMFDCTISKEIVILLNLEDYSSWSSMDLFEQSIRLAATLAEYYIREGIPCSLISGSRDITNKEPVSIESGQSVQHLFRIYEALARLDLTQSTASIIEYMPKDIFYQNENKTFILISTYHDQPLHQRYKELRRNYNNIYWILPKFYDTKISISDKTITYWEADNE